MELLEKFKPVVYLHNDETSAPCSFESYFEQSYGATNSGIDHKYHMFSPPEVTPIDETIVHRAPIPLDWIGAHNVYLHYTGEITSPKSTMLDLIPFYCMFFYHTINSVQYIDLVYVFNFIYQPPYKLGPIYLSGEHMGDIEHVRVRTLNGRLHSIYYSAHGWSQGRWEHADNIRCYGNRPLVFIAKDSHATYPAAGTWWRIFGFASDHCGKGILWNGTLQYVSPDSKYLSYIGNMGPQGVKALGARDWSQPPDTDIRASCCYRFWYPLTK